MHLTLNSILHIPLTVKFWGEIFCGYEVKPSFTGKVLQWSCHVSWKESLAYTHTLRRRLKAAKTSKDFHLRYFAVANYTVCHEFRGKLYTQTFVKKLLRNPSHFLLNWYLKVPSGTFIKKFRRHAKTAKLFCLITFMVYVTQFAKTRNNPHF